MSIVYLRKANDDVVSHCQCGDGRIGYPPQMDCPWCGCGWLFSCTNCQKVFMFAIGVELDTTWKALARESITSSWQSPPTDDDCEAWIGDMTDMLEIVEPGELYVILDGIVIPADVTNVEIEGIHSRHAFDQLPHIEALSNPSVLNDTLGDPEYWRATALEDD